MTAEGVILVQHFQRKDKKKCRDPLETHDLYPDLQNEVQKNRLFCKKDPETGVQKIFRCQPCARLIESLEALKGHLKSQKHAAKQVQFDQVKEDLRANPVSETTEEIEQVKGVDFHQTVQERLRDYDGPLVGLKYVQEFHYPLEGTESSKSGLHCVYRCTLPSCHDVGREIP